MTFLDWLMEESQTYARELGERLKERVFEEIFPHFAAGFIHDMGGPERLRALPEEEREAALDRVYQGTLTFLYRLLFLLYAESRDLLPVREVRGYYGMSLRRLSEEIAEQAGPLEDLVPRRLADAYPLRRPGAVIPSEVEGSREESRLYDHLLDLFAVIDGGSPARNVPTYNGGLFITDPDADDTGREAEAARFLEETSLPDRYLALGLDRLARDVDPKREDLGFIDYKSLGVRQLGSIYEGLLEFNVEIAEEDAVDRPSSFVVRLISDKGERKATGSYYTPDYIVKYIVRHTVGPVLDEKLDALRPRVHEAEARFRKVVKRKVELEGVTPDEPLLLQNVAGDVLRDLFDVKICDPAMGSGHFLVEAVDTITDRLVRFLDGFPFLGVFFEGMRRSILEEMERQKVTVDPGQLTDVTLLKRHVLKRCIYGVDLNPMAVELAKVSLWLDCFTLGAPLSFLDHHLRCGNSLIGAMAQEVEAEMGSPTPEGQMTFLTGPFVGLLQAADVMQVLSRLADVTLEQVRESRSLFDDFEKRAKPFKQLLDVHVARHFGVERAQEFLTLYGAEAMEAQPEELGKPYREVVEETRELYDEKRFFHWDLEFPEVFIDLERAAWKKDGGFDAVVGNPPYGVVSDSQDKRYLKERFRAIVGKGDVYGFFVEAALRVSMSGGRLGYIIPHTWLTVKEAMSLRRLLLDHAALDEIVKLPSRVFGDATVETVLLLLTLEPVSDKRADSKVNVRLYPEDQRVSTILPAGGEVSVHTQASWKEHDGLVFNIWMSPVSQNIIEKMNRQGLRLEKLAEFAVGVQAYDVTKGQDPSLAADRAYHAEFQKDETFRRELSGDDVGRYCYEWAADSWISYGPWLAAPRQPKFFRGPRIVVREITDSLPHSIPATYLEESFVTYKTILNLILRADAKGKGYRESFLLSLLNSGLITWYFYLTSNKIVTSTFPRISLFDMKAFPIRRIHFATRLADRESILGDLMERYRGSEYRALLKDIQALLPKIGQGDFLAFQPGATGAEEKSDVVHDLLAYLAEQMIAMHEEKQERIEAFWDDLEAACESPGTFEDLREHGKWEQSLWKDPACRPYVDRESHSTRHLDESLGWDEACYEAFAGMLAGRTSVTRPMLDVYRKHDEPYRVLVERIEATDELIDQIVYRLYGLTEEEIAVVEGREP